MSGPIDIVIEYVDNTDSVWQAEFNKYFSGARENRYRSWNNIQFLFRAIEQHMPFINTIHFVVSNIEQVPAWLNTNNVNIVLHKDIIPQEYLPTFNSTTIEMFIPKIKGLAEKFILFNDDMFPNKELSEDDFFIDDLPIYQLINRQHSHNIFRMQCRNSYNLARKISGYKSPNRLSYFYIKHSADPMLKSVCLELWEKAEVEIYRSLSKFREPFNFTQYLFPDYSIMTNRYKFGEFDFQYYTSNFIQLALNDIETSQHKIICINDIKTNDFEKCKNLVINSFSKRYKNKSKFEF